MSFDVISGYAGFWCCGLCLCLSRNSRCHASKSTMMVCWVFMSLCWLYNTAVVGDVVPMLSHPPAAFPLRSAVPHALCSSSNFVQPEFPVQCPPLLSFSSHFPIPEERQSQLCIFLERLPVCSWQEWREMANKKGRNFSYYNLCILEPRLGCREEDTEMDGQSQT